MTLEGGSKYQWDIDHKSAPNYQELQARLQTVDVDPGKLVSFTSYKPCSRRVSASRVYLLGLTDITTSIFTKSPRGNTSKSKKDGVQLMCER